MVNLVIVLQAVLAIEIYQQGHSDVVFLQQRAVVHPVITSRERDIAHKGIALWSIKVVNNTVGKAAVVGNLTTKSKVNNSLSGRHTTTEVQSANGEILTANLQTRLSVDDNLTCMESLNDDGFVGCALCLPLQCHIRIGAIGYQDAVAWLGCLQALGNIDQ